jgi:hypothetical protein
VAHTASADSTLTAINMSNRLAPSPHGAISFFLRAINVFASPQSIHRNKIFLMSNRCHFPAVGAIIAAWKYLVHQYSTV